MINSAFRHNCLFIPIWLHQFPLVSVCCIYIVWPKHHPQLTHCGIAGSEGPRHSLYHPTSPSQAFLTSSYMYADSLMGVHCRANQQLRGMRCVCILNMHYCISGPSICYNTLMLYIIRDTQHDLDNIWHVRKLPWVAKKIMRNLFSFVPLSPSLSPY